MICWKSVSPHYDAVVTRLNSLRALLERMESFVFGEVCEAGCGVVTSLSCCSMFIATVFNADRLFSRARMSLVKVVNRC